MRADLKAVGAGLVPARLATDAAAAGIGHPRGVPLRWALAGALTLLAVAVVVFFRLTRRQPAYSAAAAAIPTIRSIAVLPLQNLSGDPAQEYFSDGMTDALITDLAQIGSLRVISRTSSMPYKQTKKSLPEIARELNVDAIVEGTAQRSGGRVRITAQLIHGPSDRHIWADSYERDVRDLFSLERSLTQEIAHQIQARLTAPNQAPLAQHRPVNPNALEAYLQGNYHLNRSYKGSGVEERRKAGECFQQAIDADPNFVQAYIGLANAHDDLLVSSRGDREVRRKAAEKALQLDPNSSEAWAIVAGLRWDDLDWTPAEQAFRHAIGLNPNNATARDEFCMFLAEMGRLDEAWSECQIAQELDPNNDHLGAILYERGEYDHAIAMLRMMTERHPDDYGLHYLLFVNYARKGSYKESVEELEKMFTLLGLSETAAKIYHAFATSGYQGAMRQAAREWEHLQATNQFFAPVNLADTYATLGQNDRAFYWLEQAYKHGDMISTGCPCGLDKSRSHVGVPPL
jgi:TolB-like protein